MSRCAAALIAVLALVSWTAVARGDVPEGQRLIDQGALYPDGGEASARWQSQDLQPGVEYTVAIEGSITEPYAAGAVRSYDGLYCGGSAKGDSSCAAAGAPVQRAPAVVFSAGPTGRTSAYDGIDTLGGQRGEITPSSNGYDAQYTFSVIPGAASDYHVLANVITGGTCAACTGHFLVKIYGPPQESFGTVKLTLLQKGPPKSHPEDLVRSTTSGSGTLRLSTALDGGSGTHSAKVVPQDGLTLVHGDEYTIADDEALILGVVRGEYFRVAGRAEILQLRVTVVQSADPDCAEGAKGQVKIVEPVKHGKAVPSLAVNVCGHVHVYKPFRSGGSVRVRIAYHPPAANPARRARLL